ncbi:MAG TPA: transferase [Planctomycetota bacterium]|nr:transferase [Planctomycetota bacterium]
MSASRFPSEAWSDRALESEGDFSGVTNQNPAGIKFFELIAEDYRTHDRNPAEPGFWAVAVHRFGNWRMGVRHRALRLPLSAAYRVLHTAMKWLWGIDLEYTVKLGRRVRLWHHGGMVLGARRIGDDVHIRHNVTLGLAARNWPNERPVIEDEVEIGVGAVVVGKVRIGRGTVIAPNSVVLSSVPAGGWTVLGVPARAVWRRPAHES